MLSDAAPSVAGGLKISPAPTLAGGPQLRVLTMTAAQFASDVMVKVSKDLMGMKATELREELKARQEPPMGPTPWLQRRLYAAIVRGGRR